MKSKREKHKLNINYKKMRVLISLLLIPVILTGCVATTPFGVVLLMADSVNKAEEAAAEQYANIGDDYTYESDEYDWDFDEYDWDFDESDPAASTDESSSESTEETSESINSDVPLKEGEIAQTIMVYVVGSDLESEYGNATIDLNEMMDSGMDTDYNNLVVYTGGASEWQTEGLSPDENAIMVLEDDDFYITDTTDPDNMGDADTLSFFLNYCFDNFESDTYSLILWDHGAGPVLGFGLDENYEDLLTLEEIQTALDDSVGKRGTRLEWVGFDACLMNSLEVADILEPFANYMVASQETEPGWGWNYHFLGSLPNFNISGEETGKLIIDAYMDYGEYVFSEYPRMYSDLTLSCIDLTKYQAAENAINTFFDELDSSLDIDTFPELVRNRENVRDFGTYSTSFDYGMVDAIHLLKSLAPNSASAAHAVDSINDLVVYRQANMSNAGGISICYPYQTSEDYTEECISIQEDMNFASDYTGFLRNFYAIENGERIVKNWDVTKAETSVTATEDLLTGIAGSDISLQLTEEQQANYASAGYYILCNAYKEGLITEEQDARAKDTYIFIHYSRDVELDENGVLHAYYNNNAVYMRDEEGLSPIPMILIEEESTETEKRYVSYVVLNRFGEEITDWEVASANLQIVISDEYPNGIIRQAIPLEEEEDDTNNPSKQLIDLDDFDYMTFAGGGRYVTEDEQGNVKYFYDWEQSDWYLGFEIDLNKEYAMEVCPLENPENYACMFYVKDAQGNVSYSDMIPLG